MTASETGGRSNQRLRARKDLLLAAARLLKQGRSLTMDDVAKEALVSRATAYRYFPSVDALLVEAPLDGAVPGPEELFAADRSVDPEERVDRAEAALHKMVYKNEVQLRLLLKHSLDSPARESTGENAPARQNRRTLLAEAALAPARHRFDDEAYEKLMSSLALIFGIESMVIFSDVLTLGEKRAREVKSWALRALIRAALQDSETTG